MNNIFQTNTETWLCVMNSLTKNLHKLVSHVNTLVLFRGPLTIIYGDHCTYLSLYVFNVVFIDTNKEDHISSDILFN